jgi:hypothetical protein
MFSTLCLPAKIYLLLAITGIIVSLYHKLSIMNLIFSMLFIYLWTTMVNWICNKGYIIVSWFLVLLPLFSSFAFVGLYVSSQIKHV